MKTCLSYLLVTALLAPGLPAQVVEYPLDSAEGLRLINVKAEVVELGGLEGLRVTRADDYTEGRTLALIEGSKFGDGVIGIELAGEPAPWADPAMRGFIGIAFRVDPTDPNRYECFYLRPTNARADNQLQRNHSTQYVSHPEYPWYRLRDESPGMYESYVDLAAGEWTSIRIEVKGTAAALYVGEAEQPVLIVKDLKHGESVGQIGLWLHESTLAHFRNLRFATGG
ncbi:MAG: hypothetical protein WBP17_03660 [Gemmatimonadota bacterium]